MSHRFYPIALHKNEWERLKNQAGPLIPKTSAVNSREEYFDALNKQSRKWIYLWPDSAEGLRQKLDKQRRKQRKDDIALVDAFRKSKKHEDTQAALRHAKQLIFDDSCYGRQLISAITESKILEEREAQIQFQKKIKQKEAELEKNKTYGDFPLVFDDEKIKANRKLAALESVKFNEEIELTKKEKAAKLKSEKNICESVDEDMVKKFAEAKSKKKKEKKLLERQEMVEYKTEKKEIEKHRKITEDHENALIEVYKKEQDRIKCKKDAVLKNIIEESRHGERAIKYEKVIDELRKAEEKRYKDFIEKGIEMHEKRNALQEAKEIEIENKKRAERYQISEENKVAGENHKLYLQLTAPCNKCACDVQTLLIKPDVKKQLLKKKGKVEPEKDAQDGSEQFIEEDSKEDKFSFLKPRYKLVQALKRREKESSGYTGAETADKYFAKQASDALQRTKHKYFTRKVVNEYLKLNRLDASALSISNY